MSIALIPTWLQEFELEAGYMAEPKVICLFCKELKRHWIVFTSSEALKHQKETGHDSWELDTNYKERIDGIRDAKKHN